MSRSIPGNVILVCAQFIFFSFELTMAEDGYQLWLRYVKTDRASEYRAAVSHIVVEGTSATASAVKAELDRGLDGLLGVNIPVGSSVSGGGAVIAGTPTNSKLIAGLGWSADLKSLGPDGYRIESITIQGQNAIAIASNGELGVLYGAFHFLRLIQTGRPITGPAIRQSPKFNLRLLNHWDNLSGFIERGYAGGSLWKWAELPGTVDPRYIDYARACASVGINGAVLNNVNASADILKTDYLKKIAAIASALRPYGVRVYLSAKFSAPQEIGGVGTSDPVNTNVQNWWKSKCDEIYGLIPDFGGFLVKANSEGMPGPKSYGRTHAEGANCLARAVKPHGGVIFWRAFVYDNNVDADRIKRSYKEFIPLDGQFDDNVFVQAKNGPLDFQPREPAHPLFGAMIKTPMAAELQITQEYLGWSTHLVYLAPMWKEVLDFDTYCKGEGSTVAKALDGSLYGHSTSAIAGVANTGSDRNWCGHHFAQANWFAFGRLAWDYSLTSEEIARDWVAMTWGTEQTLVDTIVGMMMGSHEACVNYQEPLGLAHQCDMGHYDPGPGVDNLQQDDWEPWYYHRADKFGLGFNRSSKGGSNGAAQYFSPNREIFDNRYACPDKLLLWFHHASWGHIMHTGRTLWDELNTRYNSGVAYVTALKHTWAGLSGKIDADRFNHVAGKLSAHESHAKKWRDTMLGYFGRFYNQYAAKCPLVTLAIEPEVDRVEEGTLLKLTAEAKPQSGLAIKTVEFYADTAFIATVPAAPWRTQWYAKTPGVRRLRAVAINTEGFAAEAVVQIDIYGQAVSSSMVNMSLQRGWSVCTINGTLYLTAHIPGVIEASLHRLDGRLVSWVKSECTAEQAVSLAVGQQCPGPCVLTVSIGGKTVSQIINTIPR